MSEAFMGEIKAYGFSFAPRNFAYCNGATLGISQNTALFALLGTQFGGNGQTTFQLPNLGGRLAIGQGQSPGTSSYVIGEVGGVENTTLTQSQMPQHTHLAQTTVTPNSSALSAATTINALGAPTARSQSPANNFPTVGYDPVASTVMQNYAAAGNGTAVTMNSGMATTAISGTVTATAATTVQIAGGSLPFSIQQPYLAINYCIATVGIFPSRN